MFQIAGLWWVISSCIALFLGGYAAAWMAGISDRFDGLLHGAITWGMATLLTVYLVSSAVGSVVGGGASALGSVTSAAGGGIASAAKPIAQATSPSSPPALSLCGPVLNSRRMIKAAARPDRRVPQRRDLTRLLAKRPWFGQLESPEKCQPHTKHLRKSMVAETLKDRVSRAEMLEARRVEKMASSSHAFVRGSTVKHYEWLASMATLPAGPPVWICGDCHVGNLGPIADKQGRVAIQIRDLDQATIGNPAHDLVRLALSLASVARSSDLPGVTTARIIEQMVEGYTAGLAALDQQETAEEPSTVSTARRSAMSRSWRNLANERLGDVRPTIPLGKRFYELSNDERWNLGTLLDSVEVKQLILTLNKRSEKAKIELIDAAYWMKGCSSLGKLRYAALVHLSGERKDKLALIDIKEAGPSAAPSAEDCNMPADHAARIVAGAVALSPNLGDRMAAGTVSNHSVIIRELMPEDLKLEMEQFSRGEASLAARYLAGVVGKAHGRQMARGDRLAWTKELEAHHKTDFAAPSWLWSTVVALLTRHEGAYLEHCRVYSKAA